jgi:hypothetical protein
MAARRVVRQRLAQAEPDQASAWVFSMAARARVPGALRDPAVQLACSTVQRIRLRAPRQRRRQLAQLNAPAASPRA